VLDGPNVVAVSHVSPIKAAVSWALGAGVELGWRMFLDVASITRVGGRDGQGSLLGFNDTSHLPT
jgi:broad specificity phosphatase PhoE